MSLLIIRSALWWRECERLGTRWDSNWAAFPTTDLAFNSLSPRAMISLWAEGLHRCSLSYNWASGANSQPRVQAEFWNVFLPDLFAQIIVRGKT